MVNITVSEAIELFRKYNVPCKIENEGISTLSKNKKRFRFFIYTDSIGSTINKAEIYKECRYWNEKNPR